MSSAKLFATLGPPFIGGLYILEQQMEENNSKAYKIKRRRKIEDKKGGCTICPSHSGENADYKKHGKRKPKYKNKVAKKPKFD